MGINEMAIRKSRNYKEVKDRVFKSDKVVVGDIDRLKVIEEGRKARERIKTDFIWRRGWD